MARVGRIWVAELVCHAAWMAAGDWAELAGAGSPSVTGVEKDFAGRLASVATMARASRTWIAELVCHAANSAGSSWGLPAPTANLGAVSDDSGEPARRPAGARLAAGAASISFSSVSMPDWK